MNKNDKLYKLLNKRELSLSEIRYLMECDEVSSIETGKSDRKLYHRYNIRLNNDELYFAYVKKSLSEIIKSINQKD
jgi:hypothetical protein